MEEVEEVEEVEEEGDWAVNLSEESTQNLGRNAVRIGRRV